MSVFGKLEKNLRPVLFYGNNWISLIGGALTTASAFVLIGFWIVSTFGRSGPSNPYAGIILDLFLPGLFVIGLLLIPVGIWIRRRQLQAAGQVPAAYPQIDLRDPIFRRGIEIVVMATFVNFVIVGTASYRGIAYMDSPSFCGTTCHVMQPEWNGYHVANHSNVACSDCHIVPGAAGFVHAKVNGTKQLLMVMFHKYPTPIMADDKVPPAWTTCQNCHNPARYIGDQMVVETSYGDDEKNSRTSTVLVMHVGGRDALGHLSGIHGAHMDGIEYISTDKDHQTIPWVAKRNADGSVTEFLSSDAKAKPAGTVRTMDCIDCHNRAAHSFSTPEEALNKEMNAGTPSSSLPFVHKQALALLKADYASQDEAVQKITAGLDSFYQSQYPAVWSGQRAQIDQAAKAISTIYTNNVFPFMKVTWGTHPNNIGHNTYVGCFRCHDGSHSTKDGKTTITNDCTACHNLVSTDEASPKALADLGIQ
ncbi:MAG TPA: NapC/NirT family cytochrome c [Acidobacteriaceae bacterium]|nr:NapC/NirT family cytochrome c [Acidobacteriaceae bacterium]